MRKMINISVKTAVFVGVLLFIGCDGQGDGGIGGLQAAQRRDHG